MTASAPARPQGQWLAARLEAGFVLSPGARRLATVGFALLAIGAIFVQLSTIWVPMEVGLDFSPLRDAAHAVLHGQSVYTDPFFVYPPSAAIPLLPFALGGAVITFRLWVIAGIGALLWAVVLIVNLVPRRDRAALVAVGATLLIGSAVATDSLLLGNLSPLLAPFAVYSLLSFERGQWTRGCVVLVISLLLKPLLAPLLLLPVVRRQWRALALSLGPGALTLILACALIPGAAKLSQIARYVLGGTNLHGRNAVNNLSLQGWGEFNHQPGPALVAAAAVAVVGVLGFVRWARSGTDGTGAVQIGTAVLLTVFLAGRISEVHFLLAVMASTLLAVVLRPSWRSAALLLPAAALLVLPHMYFNGLVHSGWRLQTGYVVAQLLLWAAMLRPVSSPLAVRR